MIRRSLLILSLLSPAFARGEESYLDALLSRARAEKTGSALPWRRLLHFLRGKSQADGPKFFLSPKGSRDPAAELEADLRAFFVPAPSDPEGQGAQCRFPARYAWLKERLGFDPARLPEQPCPRFEKWLSKMDPAGLTLIYASAYLNNPASMYGHTFLRIEPAGARAADPLLAYSINFAAETNQTNGLVFAARGLLGGYPGRFSTHPYYMKVQQYTNMESRDLWEYRLNVSSETTRRVLMHLWEMGETWFDYYFFTENCSYQLLPLLEAADPSLDLSRRFHFKAIPVDTLRAVTDSPGLVKERALRPSVMRGVMSRRALLSPGELLLSERLAVDPGADLGLLPPDRRGPVLDSAHDLVRYKHRFARYSTEEEEALERTLLERRGKAGGPSPDVSMENRRGALPPETGHRTGRVGLGGGRSGGRGFMEASLRGAMHDAEEDPSGYVPGNRLEMIHLRLRVYDAPARAAVSRFTGVDILSLTPVDRWVRSRSWKVFLGLDAPLDRGAAPGKGLIFRANGGGGSTWGGEKAMLYGLAGVDAGAGGALSHRYRLGWEAEAGVLLRPARPWGLHGTAFHRRHFLGERRTTSGFRAAASRRLADRWETRLSWERAGRRREWMWMLNLYV